jgi:hypothetical protein
MAGLLQQVKDGLGLRIEELLLGQSGTGKWLEELAGRRLGDRNVRGW